MKQLLAILCLLALCVVSANESTPKVRYQLMFKAHGIHCLIRVNDIYVYNSRDVIQKGYPVQVSFGHGITEFLNQGQNDLSVQATNSAKYIHPKEINGAYCEVKIMAMVDNPETGGVDQKVVSDIRYTYVPKPEDSDAVFPYLLSISESEQDLDERLASNQIVLEQLPHVYDANKKPIQRTLATRTFNVNHPQPFSWVNRSTPFVDTPANRQKLWEKYGEIRTAIERKDKKAIRKLAEPGVTDMAKYYGDTPDNHFEFSFGDTLQNYFDLNKELYKPDNGVLDDYDLELYAGGKLFRLNQKGYDLMPPLQWKNNLNRITRRYSPIFTYIDGKIVMAWF